MRFGSPQELTVKGKYNRAVVFTTNVEEEAIRQITELCNLEVFADSQIRIMPDVHAGIGCVIGTTMTIKDKVIPNLVGVDIGCGMEVARLEQKDLNLDELDRTIHRHIPAGFDIRDTVHKYTEQVALDSLRCIKHVDLKRARLSIGTLGGGNHFIEANTDEEGNLYLVVHSGSRHLGNQIARYYQEVAWIELQQRAKDIDKLIERYKREGRLQEIEPLHRQLSLAGLKKDLAFLEGKDFEDYIHDMRIAQEYAYYNRKAIMDEILTRLKLSAAERFTTIHNYIDLEHMILRKGAISAQRGEKVLIPINMRDGSIIAVGKGNPEWNYSAPHGAGRIMSRSKAKQVLSLDEFKKSMAGIYSSTVNHDTIDEAPMVYKPMDEIIANTRDAVEIIKIIKPIYNFKAAEDRPRRKKG